VLIDNSPFQDNTRGMSILEIVAVLEKQHMAIPEVNHEIKIILKLLCELKCIYECNFGHFKVEAEHRIDKTNRYAKKHVK
jgi:hypothetical protein